VSDLPTVSQPASDESFRTRGDGFNGGARIVVWQIDTGTSPTSQLTLALSPELAAGIRRVKGVK